MAASHALLPTFRTGRSWFRSTAGRPRAIDFQIVNRVRELSRELAARRDADLASMVEILRQEVRQGRNVLELRLLTTCFAVTTEAVRRVLGMTYYDVQLLAGLALATSAIAEMKTGEGKTIVAILPAVLRSLEGHGVHVATVNAYLAQRDFDHLQGVYKLLGVPAELLPEGGQNPPKQLAYAADVVYGTGYEFGFDYLRDQAAIRRRPQARLGDRFLRDLRGERDRHDDTVQRELAFAIIDEVDSVLLDEANTPLIISASLGDGSNQADIFRRAADVARRLRPQTDYLLQPRERSIVVTETGQQAIYGSTGDIPPAGLVRPWQTYVENALRAEHFMRRDGDYIVRDGKVLLVDQYTGRIFTDRSWQDGLHQAVEWKEEVPLTAEKQALARISRQRFYGRYRRLCGMTGTATGHESEFRDFYQLPVVVVPERRPNQRRGFPTRCFRSEADKWNGIASEIHDLQQRGRPVLVGTCTIQESEGLSEVLTRIGLTHRVLNGKQDEDEAALVARAGEPRAITIATNMAGRGTDIKLAAGVADLGGLHVIATQRQESRRVDRQLIGRCGRQGDPGSYRFYVSPDDPLIQQFDSALGDQIRSACGTEAETAKNFDAAVDRVQQLAEARRFEQRCQLHQHDSWLNEVLTTVAERTRSSALTTTSADRGMVGA